MTRSGNCWPTFFQLLASVDVVGRLAADMQLLRTERDCQRACCDTAGCVAYSFAALQVAMGGSFAPCFLLSNISSVVPSHSFTSGIFSAALQL
jgi:hypothetical protein